MVRSLQNPLRVLLLATVCAAPLAHAQLFGDDQARQAIIDLRQRFDQAVTAQNKLVEENTQLRRSMLELQREIEDLRRDMASLRGQQEQFTRDLSGFRVDSERPVMQAPTEVGGTASVLPPQLPQGGEKEQYQAALDAFRAGDFKTAQTGFANFVKAHPRSPQAPEALFWLGNAQYATRNYREAISNFQSLVTAVPTHAKAPEAMLSMASCQIELNQKTAARATLDALIQRYPDSAAAQTARDRLAKLG